MAQDADVWQGRWWRREGERVVCGLCPRGCVLKDGARGFCFVRQNVGGQMVLTTYGRSTGFCVDPIEKKPLNHFYPGTSVLSFGTAGCNLGCKFCQNWDISKSRQIERLSDRALPEQIARAARSLDCASVAFTYNDPVIWAEYAIETAKACRAEGIKTVAVTAGYITEQARGEFFEAIDAANVDLKAFSEEFYHRLTLSHLQPVLDNLRWLKTETDVWFEITNLIIPQANDDPDELRRLCDWILGNVGDEVPVHFSAFHPDFRMQDRPATPHETLIAAHDTAKSCGIRYPYVGNVHDRSRQNTYCPGCGALLIERDWYQLGRYGLRGDSCAKCGKMIAGHFADKPGDWGRKRLPVNMQTYAMPEGEADAVNRHAEALTQALDAIKSNVSSHSPKNDEGDSPMAMPAPQDVELTAAQQEVVLATAAECIKAASLGRQPSVQNLESVGVAQQPISGAFTSLKRGGQLRSCCGCFGRTMTLKEAVQQAAHQTATSDPRFPPISPSEFPYLDLEVWLLFAPEVVQETGVDRVKAVTIGKHGLKIIRGSQQGLLLPGVATDHNWNSEEFLNNVCIKAGLPPTAWKDDDTILYRFGGRVIRGHVEPPTEQTAVIEKPPLYSEGEVAAYAQFCRETLAALIRGATPQYYCTTVSDENVNGAMIIVTLPGTDQELNLSKLNIRQPMPLQATLFSLCEELASSLRRRGMLSGNYGLDVVIAHDVAMHGTAADLDLAGVDAKRRGILVTETNKTALVYDSNRSSQDVLQEATRMAQVADPAFTRVFSLAILSTRDAASVASVPEPMRGQNVRPATVAGTFYPAEPSQISRTLDEFLAEPVARQAYRAAMVPHAGWRFSGQLAARVLNQVKLPGTIIAFGPKHTPQGVDCAVAPHHTWSIPGGEVASDYELATRLAAQVPELELDAVSHRQEHCLEVQLPIIARLAPETRFVGILVSGNTNLERCGQLAEGIAGVLKECDEPPLLLISTDMNHYASDEETRRLDEMALAALDRLDPDELYRTVRSNHISMCGVIPTVIVLKTLQHLDALHECERVGYATSADAGGDTNRVVGYAGMLFR